MLCICRAHNKNAYAYNMYVMIRYIVMRETFVGSERSCGMINDMMASTHTNALITLLFEVYKFFSVCDDALYNCHNVAIENEDQRILLLFSRYFTYG